VIDGKIAPLNELCIVEYGTRVVQKRDGGNIYPVYGGGGATFKMDTFNRKDRLVISRFGMSKDCTRFVNGKFYLNDSGLTVSPKDRELLPRFLDYQLFSLNDIIFDLGKGSAQKNLDVPAFRDLPIFIPRDIREQQRLVGILDEAFEAIATAKANAEKNLRNAREVFESYLAQVFSQRGEEWKEKTFGDLIESNVIGLTKASREQGDDKAWRYVKMNNITRENKFDFSHFASVDATNEEVKKFSLKDGDFLFNTRNSFELVGKSCIFESDSDRPALFNNNIMRVRFVTGIDARFVLLAFSTKTVSEKLNTLKNGTTNVSAIYFKDLKSLAIPVPSIKTQKIIASKLEVLQKETQQRESICIRKLAALEDLKKSLLHQAFNGEL
jgi:type I restriction enzyme S subunit